MKDSQIREPPSGIFARLRHIGPGLILSAAIVGSGELIATTALGAKAGFALLWIILMGCLVKVAVQVEYGRYAITHGQAAFHAWNQQGSGKLFNLHWSTWAAIVFLGSVPIGLGGVLGGAAQVLTYAVPGISIEIATVVLALTVALLVFRGRYRVVELTSTALNLIFISTIAVCVFGVQGTRYAFGLSDLMGGLTLQLPVGTVALALGAFGTTGVESSEIFTYPSWCVEKGYALWTGPFDGSSDWLRRARGWTRVMVADALVSMVVYTTATCFFYILGATVLRPQGDLADGNELILQLSGTFTEVLGQEAVFVFMLGAFTVLFSTVFSNAAGMARLWTDFFVLCGIVKKDNSSQRQRSIAVMSWVLPCVWALVYLSFQKPLFWVVFMGIANSMFLLIVAYKALVLRYQQTEIELVPSRWYDVVLWLSTLSIGVIAAWALRSTLSSVGF